MQRTSSDDRKDIIYAHCGTPIIVSRDDVEFLRQFKWRLLHAWTAYAQTTINGRVTTMHQLLMNPPDGRYVDHVNGNGLDNRRSNLRLVTNQQNQANSTKRAAASSKHKGVSWSKTKKKWRAYICPNKKYIHLGYFTSEEDAASAYDRAAEQIFGEYARTNSPGTGPAADPGPVVDLGATTAPGRRGPEGS